MTGNSIMLRALLDMRQYRLRAVDKDLGSVEDFYFDDRVWKVRYMVVDTGHWLPGRQVLIGQEALEQPDFENQVLPVALTSTEVEESLALKPLCHFLCRRNVNYVYSLIGENIGVRMSSFNLVRFLR